MLGDVARDGKTNRKGAKNQNESGVEGATEMLGQVTDTTAEPDDVESSDTRRTGRYKIHPAIPSMEAREAGAHLGQKLECTARYDQRRENNVGRGGSIADVIAGDITVRQIRTSIAKMAAHGGKHIVDNDIRCEEQLADNDDQKPAPCREPQQVVREALGLQRTRSGRRRTDRACFIEHR